MNAPAPLETNSFVLTPDELKDFNASWARLAASKTITAEDCLFRALILGKDPFKAFSAVTNKNKLSNGQTPYQGLAQAVSLLTNWRAPAVSRLLSNVSAARQGELILFVHHAAKAVFNRRAA